MRILLIEDNSDLAANISDFLTAHGHQVEHAYTGTSGLSFASSETFDVILLDLMLPKLDGIQVCNRLRQHYQVNTPILMITARDVLENKLEGFAVGADDYLVKPFALAELLARAHALHNRNSGQVAAQVLQVGNLIYDLRSETIHRNGVPLLLRPASRTLLKLLMRQSPGVVSTQSLADALWGENPPDGEVLRAHLYNLRQAIDKNQHPPLLQTVHGIGYRLALPAVAATPNAPSTHTGMDIDDLMASP